MASEKCDRCGKAITNPTPEEEMMEEYMETFGPVIATMDEKVTVCDDCYEKCMKAITPERLEFARNQLLKKRSN